MLANTKWVGAITICNFALLDQQSKYSVTSSCPWTLKIASNTRQVMQFIYCYPRIQNLNSKTWDMFVSILQKQCYLERSILTSPRQSSLPAARVEVHTPTHRTTRMQKYTDTEELRQLNIVDPSAQPTRNFAYILKPVHVQPTEPASPNLKSQFINAPHKCTPPVYFKYWPTSKEVNLFKRQVAVKPWFFWTWKHSARTANGRSIRDAHVHYLDKNLQEPVRTPPCATHFGELLK